MIEGRVLPDDPLEFIRECIATGEVYWTYHVMMRLKKHSLTVEQVIGSAASFEVIEPYPEDKYLPSYLVRAEDEDGVFHILIATDVPNPHIRMVTAYRPDPSEWDHEFKRRAKQ